MDQPATHHDMPYICLLSGTHVTGKETLAITISETLGCRWIKSEWMHVAAQKAANAQSQRGLNYNAVFKRVYSTKLQQAGLDFKAKESLLALITCFHMTPFERNAMRQTLLQQNVKPIFVILHITPETLSGRTLGAEEPELAARIMAIKAGAIQEPLDEEKDVIIVDSLKNVDELAVEMPIAIRERMTTQRQEL